MTKKMGKAAAAVLALALLLMGFSVLADEPASASRFEGDVSIQMITPDGDGEVYYGDVVSLVATMSGVEGPYTVVWERWNDGMWESVGQGDRYSFQVTESSAPCDYRAMVVMGE